MFVKINMTISYYFFFFQSKLSVCFFKIWNANRTIRKFVKIDEKSTSDLLAELIKTGMLFNSNIR